MDRVYHKKDVFYNTDNVDEKIGLDKNNMTYDKVDVFIDRIHKKIGFAVVSYKVYENGKEIVKQFVPYIETEQDLKEFINNTFTKEMNIHYIDLSYTNIVKNDERKDKNYRYISCVEYVNGVPKKNYYRILIDGTDEILRVIKKFHDNDPRIHRRFDGYTREPYVKPHWRIIQEEKLKKQANSMPMPQPSITNLRIQEIKATIKSLKDYTLKKIKPSKKKEEPRELHYRHRSR